MLKHNLIAGEWVAGTPSPNINPSDTDDVIGEYHQAEPADAQRAIDAARHALASWSRGPLQQRADILDRVGMEILQRVDELGDLLAREEGKTLREARGEVTRAGHIFRFFAGEVVRQTGQHLDSIRPGVEIDVTREPVGVVSLSVHDAFVAALIAKMDRQVVGDARAAETTIGPVVDERQLQSNLEHLERAQAEGATLLTGGNRLKRETSGFYQAPALLAETKTGMRINQEEVFGPVASVIRVADFDEALDVANGVRFGLAAGICTTSLKSASRFRREAQAGMVMVNLPTAGVDYHVPFGGRKGSSHGPREQGTYAAEFYTTVKTSYVRP